DTPPAGGYARSLRDALPICADAALVVTPPYVRPTQAGLLAHYTALADDGALPLVMYNVPARTGCDLLPASVAALADHPRIIGIRDRKSPRLNSSHVTSSYAV